MTDLASMKRRQFLLTEGGPAYQLETKVGLNRANSSAIIRRAVFSILLTWVPLLLLTVLQGTASGHLVEISFLHDFAVHARFLLAVPILLIAESILGPRLAHAANHFAESGLIAEEDIAGFDAAIESGLRWRDSILAEIVLVFLAYTITYIALVSMAVHVSTWYALRTSSGVSLTWAGWWFGLFCVPLFQFLSLRWLWRLFLWAQFLVRMDRLNLRLIPTHPDEAGGMGFVGEAQRYFGVILFPFSVTVAGVLANDVVFDKARLEQFAPAIAIYIILAVSLVMAPLLVFSKTLRRTKRIGLLQYGTLALEYTSSFHRKWIVDRRQTKEDLLGSGDIQSLADLGNSFAFVERMNVVPVGSRTPIILALSCLVPLSPLLLTMMPLGELLKMVVKIVM